MKKWMIAILLGIISIIVVVFLYCDSNKYYRDSVSLVECVDGDTAWFMVHGKKVKVRLLGIDAPEIAHEDKEAEYYGEEAKNTMCRILNEAINISFEYDSKSDLYDKYQRLLVWVFVDDELLNEILVRDGYASVKYIYQEYRYVDRLCMAQEKAYQQMLGIWRQSLNSYSNNYCNKRSS